MDPSSNQRAGAGEGRLQSNAVGFFLSVLLTTAAFALVIKGQGLLPRGGIIAGMTVAAVIQILVQLRCFLHMDGTSTASWNGMALIFTILIMALFVVGTLWIMTDLNFRMM